MLRIAATLALVACSRDRTPPVPPPHRDAAPVPSFAREVAPVLAKHCTAKECHGDKPTPDITMDLRPTAAYRALVGVRGEMGERTCRA